MEDVVELLWRQERVLITEPQAIDELIALCPGTSALGARKLDLQALNDLLSPRGMAATWDSEGLALFRRPAES
jgi:hypothetical protein